MTLILCGFCCAGKTMVGKALANKLTLPFYDTDQLLEAAHGGDRSYSQVWKELGSTEFRNLEKRTILSLKKQRCVIATGGGTLLDEESRNYLKTLGTLVYLKSSISILYKRMLKRGTPAYLNKDNPRQHFEEIALQRFSLFEKHCQDIVDTEQLTLDQIVCRLYGK
ncbi:MAG: Shikimate kinase 1 [Chlamydiales bacterium]|nr:Shikimate kinase 1 [Chlamydiales bacterium]